MTRWSAFCQPPNSYTTSWDSTSAHRSGRADRNHQDPPTTLLLYRRTAHPLGAPPHFASAPELALGNPVQWRPGTTARHPTPGLTAPSSPDPLIGQPIVPANSHQLGPRGTLPVYRLSIPPPWPPGRHHRASVAASRRPHPHLLESGLARSPSLTHHPWCQRQGGLASVDSGLGTWSYQITNRVPPLR